MSCGRSKKTTSRQYEVMINFIKNHKSLIDSKLSESFTAKDKDSLWAELTDILNSDGFGPVKTADRWRKVS